MQTYEDIRRKTALESRLKEESEICKTLALKIVDKVFKEFKEQTGLAPKDHLHDLARTEKLYPFVRSVGENWVSVEFVVEKGGWFKDEVYLKAVFYKHSVYDVIYTSDHSPLTLQHLDKFKRFLSKMNAL